MVNRTHPVREEVHLTAEQRKQLHAYWMETIGDHKIASFMAWKRAVLLAVLPRRQGSRSA